MKTLKLTLLSLALAASAFAQTVVSKEGVGEAAVIAKDEMKAFEEAKDKALRSAIEQAAGVRIDSDTVVVNNQLVRDQIFSNTSGYVKKFDVVEKKVEKGVVTVKVKADILTENLDKDVTAARDLVKRMGRPSIVIVVQEQTIPIGGKSTINSESLATVLTEALKADGWDIKDAQAMNGKLKLEAGVTLGSADFKEVGNLSKAQYLLYGKAALRHQEAGEMLKNSPVFPVTGEYDLTMAALDSAEQIVKVNGKLVTSPGSGVPVVSYERTTFDLIKSRREEIVGPMRKAILEHLRDQSVNGKRIDVTVSGLENFTAVKDFGKAMAAIKGIKEAATGEFKEGKAAYRVTYLGSSQDFAEAIEAATFKKKKLNIVSVTGNALEVQVGK